MSFLKKNTLWKKSKKWFKDQLVRALKDKINRDNRKIIGSKEDKVTTELKNKFNRDIRKIKTRENRNIESEEYYAKPVGVSNFWNNN